MQEVFEKIIEKMECEYENLKEMYKRTKDMSFYFTFQGVNKAIEIVKQEAEQYNNGWIPCSEDNKNFPADCEMVRVTLWSGDEFTGYRKDDKWFVYGGCGIAEADVIAWQQTQPYQSSGDHKKKTNFDVCCESVEAMAQIIDIAKTGWTKEKIMEWLQSEVEE